MNVSDDTRRAVKWIFVGSRCSWKAHARELDGLAEALVQE